MTSQRFVTRDYGPKSNHVVFILGGWKTQQWLYWWPAYLLRRRGFRCIVYTYDADVFSPDVPGTLQALQDITDAIKKHIAACKKEGAIDITVFGFSLGGMLATMVANGNSNVNRLVLNLAGASPADTVWEWDDVLPSFKQAVIAQGITLSQLQNQWAALAPLNNCDHLDGQKILVYLAAHDKVIPYAHGQQFVAELRRRGYDFELVTNAHLPHAPAGVMNFLRARRYLAFLNAGR